MNERAQLQASLWLMVIIQTIGAVDIVSTEHNPRKLPAPKNYVAAVVVWGVLGLIADAGQARAAAVMGWVTVATAMFISFKGNAANQIGNFLTKLSALYAPPSQQQGTTTA